MSSKSTLPYSTRAASHPNALARTLFNLAEQKNSNLVLSADVKTATELLDLADRLGPYIVAIKTHIDIISDFSFAKTIPALQGLAKKHKFIIFEDRKFVDIGNTVKKQYEGGVYQISKWAHVVNAALLAGPGCIEALEQVALASEVRSSDGEEEHRGLLILAEMTSTGSLTSQEYVSACVAAARKHKRSVIGFVATRMLTTAVEGRSAVVEVSEDDKDEDFIYFTTGINLASKGDALGQRYVTPASAAAKGADFLIAGRGIYACDDPVAMAKRYRGEGWNAYLDRVGKRS